MNFSVADDEVAVFVACLVLGTLDRIEKGTLGPEAGIWSLAIPRVLSAMQTHISPALADALRGADDWAALEERVPEAFTAARMKLRAAAEAELHALPRRDFALQVLDGG